MSIKLWEIYVLAIIKGKRQGLIPKLVCLILWLLSIPYRIVMVTRNWLFDHGWFRSYIPPVTLVISVGNITAGGTGKTPVTLKIAEALYDEFPVAILSRGYRSQAERCSSPLVLNKSQGLLHPASLCGDEPYLLAENLPNAYVIVGRDRYLSSKIAARLGVEAVILDDGMQHRAIARDMEVVVMDLFDPFGQGYYLPRGLLREGRHALARADLIILNHAHETDRFENIKRQVSHATTAPVVGTKLEVVATYTLKHELIQIEPGMPVGIFCGIAHPEYFRNTVELIGGKVVAEFFLPDHDALDLDKLLKFSKECEIKGAKALLCTEKDRVKLADPHLTLPLGWVKTELKIVEGEEHWNAFLHLAKQSLKGKK